MSERIFSAITTALARVFNVLHTRRVEVPDLYSPDNVSDDFAPDLAWNVGLSDDVRLRDFLTTANDFRRWTELAGAVWVDKGEHDVYAQVVQAATGTRIYVFDWHNLVAAPTLFPGLAFTTVSTLDNGHYQTTIGIEDLDGTLSRDAAEAAVDLVRPMGEGVLIVFVRLVENWRQGLGRWDVAAAGLVSTVGDILTLGPDAVFNSQLALDIPTAITDTWDRVHYEWIQQVVSGTSNFRFRIGAGEYQLHVTEGAGPNNVALLRNAATVATATFGIVASTDYYFVVSTYPLISGDLEIQVRIDGALQITHVDAVPIVPGTIAFRVVFGTDSMIVKWASVIDHAPELRQLNL